MTDHESTILKMQLKVAGTSFYIAWRPDEQTCRRVMSIRMEQPAREDDPPEPGPIACFADGDYVALWNCEASDFVRIMPIFPNRS